MKHVNGAESRWQATARHKSWEVNLNRVGISHIFSYIGIYMFHSHMVGVG